MPNSAGRDCRDLEELARRSGRRVFSRMFSPLWVAYIGRFGRRPNSSFSGRMFDRSTPALLSRNEFKISSRRGRFCMPLSASSSSSILLRYRSLCSLHFDFFFFSFLNPFTRCQWIETYVKLCCKDINSVEVSKTSRLSTSSHYYFYTIPLK